MTNTDNDTSTIFYESPGMILNQRLIVQSEVLGVRAMKQTLVEYFDYEVVSKSVWQHLYSWYSADIAICREIVKDNSGGRKGHRSDRYLMTTGSRVMTTVNSKNLSKSRVYLELFPEL